MGFLNNEPINQFSSIRLFRDHQPAIHGCQRAQTKAQHPFPSASNSATSPGEPCPKILQSPMQKMLCHVVGQNPGTLGTLKIPKIFGEWMSVPPNMVQ